MRIALNNKLPLALSIVAVAVTVAGSTGVAQAAANLITGSQIKNGTVAGIDIKNGSVGSTDLAAGVKAQLGTVADGSIGTVKLADNAVTTAKVADGSLLAADLADGAVGTVKLADAAVNGAKVADGSLDGDDAGIESGNLNRDFNAIGANGCTTLAVNTGTGVDMRDAAVSVTMDTTWPDDLSISTENSDSVGYFRLTACNLTGVAIDPPATDLHWIAFSTVD